MQRMLFVSKTPLERPEADVYFLKPQELGMMPQDCWSAYTLCRLDERTTVDTLQQLPENALVVDYLHSPLWGKLGVQPKKVLEDRVAQQWRTVEKFLRGHRIDISKLVIDGMHNVEAMDDALDTLLGGYASKFLLAAGDFQRALELARPLKLAKKQRTLYDSLALLAHRVQALSPGAFATRFLEVYDENDSFFLYDPARVLTSRPTETLEQAYSRHKAAGRHHLARSLQNLVNTKT